MFCRVRLNILIYINFLIFQVLFLYLFIYLLAHIIVDLFNYIYAQNFFYL
jgi:hypothetical protein